MCSTGKHHQPLSHGLTTTFIRSPAAETVVRHNTHLRIFAQTEQSEKRTNASVIWVLIIRIGQWFYEQQPLFIAGNN